MPDSAIDGTAAANQAFLEVSRGELSFAVASACPDDCLPPVALTAVPDGELRVPYFLQWSLALEHQLGNTASLRVQYVGTRAVNSRTSADQRIPDGLRGMLRAVTLRAAD